MSPGPKEPTAPQLQHPSKLLVDDLLTLYTTGTRVKTPKSGKFGEQEYYSTCYAVCDYATGRLLRVILLALVCDHPAMCKIAGFADHAHKAAPCPKCKVTQANLFSEASMRNGIVSHIQLPRKD
jgi:hypothetical protein